MRRVSRTGFSRKFLGSETGGQLYEYSLLVLVLAVGLIIAVGEFGERILDSLQASRTQLEQ